MNISSILVFLAFGILFRLFGRGRGRGWALYGASILAIYWLQPASPVRYLDFWFPTLTLLLALLGWVFTTPAEERSWRANAPAAAVLAGLVALVGLTRFFEASGILIASRPPAFEQVLAALALAALLAGLLGRVRLSPGALWAAVGGLVLLLLALKTPPVAQALSAALRGLMDQSTTLAAASDVRWLGFSYVAFRLIHTLRERQTSRGRFPSATLQEYLTYIIFAPSFTAGPIDRMDRFVRDLRGTPPPAPARSARPAPRPAAADGVDGRGNPPPAPALIASPPVGNPPSGEMAKGAGGPPAARTWTRLLSPQDPALWAAAGERLVLGLLKKFVIADGLALVALNATSAAQVQGAGWTWLLVYAYSLQIYFDFSGYTDIAIGLARLLGVTLPENFNAPYLKPNLTQFWSNWHMTLTNWFRAYYFNPLTRWLRTFKLPGPVPAEGEDDLRPGLPPTFIIFFTQLTTMILIGLWHGVTWNFVLWGVWHGLGQFIQNRFTDWMRPRYAALEGKPRLHSAVTVLTTLVTFHYVALGWVFFALPDVGLAGQVFGKLFGF